MCGSGTDMSIAIKDSSTWRYPRSIEVKDSGVWRTVKTLSYKDSGTWRVLVNFIGAVVVGSDGSSIYGYTQNPYGSLTPSTDINSHSISALYYYTVPDLTYLVYSGSNGEYTGFTQTGYIKRLLVDGTEVETSASNFGLQSSDSTMLFRWTGDVFSLASKVGQTLAVQITPA